MKTGSVQGDTPIAATTVGFGELSPRTPLNSSKEKKGILGFSASISTIFNKIRSNKNNQVAPAEKL